MAIFFRLLASPIPAKGDDLRQQIAALNRGQLAEDIFRAFPADFSAIPGTPFAYWVKDEIRQLFVTHPRLEQDGRIARVGDHPGDSARYLRLFFEVSSVPQIKKRHWVSYQKGGYYSPYYADIHLVVDWDFEHESYFEFHGRIGRSSEHPSNYQLFFRSGLTWPRRTVKGLNFRALPQNCAFADKGPVIFSPNDEESYLLALLAVTNSSPFRFLVKLQMAAGSFEVGVIQQTPIPSLFLETKKDLAKLAFQAYEHVLQPALGDETTHVFCQPLLLSLSGVTLAERLQGIVQVESQRQAELTALQSQIDARVTELYGVPELGQASIEQTRGTEIQSDADESLEEEDDDEANGNIIDNASLVADLLMWCVGVAFGRWDVRYVMNPKTLPHVPGPFDPLPVCSPGMLTGSDGFPPTASPENYPLPIAWDGFLVDDPGHPRDIITAVRGVFNLLWHDQAEAIEAEACQILGTPDLRSWFRDPRGFFAYHIKRYSKSRRKAPIYWLLQSAKRNYGIWLYYPRLNPDSLFRAGREYTDAKLNLEAGRLIDLQNGLAAAAGSARKVQEIKISAQAALVAEFKSFQKALDAAAMLELKPDLNDGVLLNIAPLHELVPWKEAERAWQELLRGKYEWSSMSKWLRHKGLVKG